uniref:protein unc-93 homolog A-like isoform X1 n=1 Tax=Styela clava TaxID=7725 RepID=UPI00193954CE|nr:protein unc-93 homolog A-like isoform X1 [Styela clava]
MVTSSEETRTKTKFYVFAISVFITFGSFFVIMALQSSINIEDGLGNKAVTTGYASSIVCALLVTPVLLRILKPKVAIIFSDVCYLLYAASNAYPSLYTLIPGSILVGIGSATTWPCTSLFNVYFGLEHWRFSSGTPDFYVQSYTAKFFGVFQFSQVIGNAITTITFQQTNNKQNQTSSENNTKVANSYENKTSAWRRNVSVCGANDCQDPNITSQNLQQYVPPTNKSLYIVVGVLSTLIILSIIVKVMFLPKIPACVQLPKKKSYPKSKNRNQSSVPMVLNDKDAGEIGDIVYKETEVLSTPQQISSDMEEVAQKISVFNLLKQTTKATFLHFISLQHVLVAGITFYNGIMMSFVYSELTRAYASCVLGLYQVGIGIIIYGLGDVIFSFFVAKTPTTGMWRNFPVLLAFTADILNYLFCLTWEPNADNPWVIYLFFLGFGCSDGIWQTLSNFRYGEYFSRRKDIAFTTWNLWINFGFFVQYSLSSYMCVYKKIYMNMALLIVASVLYGFAEYRYLTMIRVSK